MDTSTAQSLDVEQFSGAVLDHPAGDGPVAGHRELAATDVHHRPDHAVPRPGFQGEGVDGGGRDDRDPERCGEPLCGGETDADPRVEAGPDVDHHGVEVGG